MVASISPHSEFSKESIVSQSDSSKPVALIFGYDDDVRYLLKTFLGLWKCETMEIESESELTNISGTISPELILFDLSRDFRGDLDLLRRLRELETLKNTPVFVFSGYTRPENLKTAFEFGATEYFGKPVDFERLKDTIGNYMHC